MTYNGHIEGMPSARRPVNGGPDTLVRCVCGARIFKSNLARHHHDECTSRFETQEDRNMVDRVASDRAKRAAKTAEPVKVGKPRKMRAFKPDRYAGWRDTE